MATKYYQDDNTSTISPQLMKSIQDTNTNNVGTHIAKLFDNLGNVEEYKYKKQEEAQEKAVKKEIEGINLEAIKNQAQDKQNFMKYVKSGKSLDESGIEFNSPEVYTLAKDFGDKKKQLIDDEALKYNLAQANSRFTKADGTFDNTGFYSYMDDRLNQNLITPTQYAGVIDAVNKGTKSGIYAERETEKDRLGLIKTQLEIKKTIQDLNNPDRGKGASTNEIEKAKERYNILLKGGAIPEGQDFPQWYAQSGGDVKLKTEGITTAKNNLTKQFTGLEQINQLLLNKYTPSDVGIVDGAIQGLREFTNLHNSRSGEIESDRNGLTMALTKALAGGNASNKDLAKAESIVGGAFQTESGASSKYKAALNQSIIAIGETINQLENAGYDPKNEKARLNKMIDFSESIKEWDGSTTIQDFFNKSSNKKTNSNGTEILRKRDNTQSTPTTINNVEDFDKLLGL